MRPLANMGDFLRWLSTHAEAFVAPGMLESTELAGERLPAAVEHATESAYERVSVWFCDVCPDIPEDALCSREVHTQRELEREDLEREAMGILRDAALTWVARK